MGELPDEFEAQCAHLVDGLGQVCVVLGRQGVQPVDARLDLLLPNGRLHEVVHQLVYRHPQDVHRVLVELFVFKFGL